MDTIHGVLNLTAILLLLNLNAESYFENVTGSITVKDLVDYFILAVLVSAWFRFFFYFLVIEQISKLLLTLYKMIADTMAFVFIVACVILVMASIFTTLYQDYNQDHYASLRLSIVTLFDAAMAVYSYDNMGRREQSHTYLMIFITFFFNVLLMNYIIAILSTTYQNQREAGIFNYKTSLYKYCERYINGFRSRIGELVIHPPPISVLTVLILPLSICKC